jgi:transposase-like protein
MQEDYPRTLLELEKRFGTDSACREYLAALRWPEGFVCPRCGGRQAWAMSRGLWLCRQCRRQTSITAATIFQDSRLPLTLWFRAIWHLTSQKTGASALGMQRVLGLGSYQTAWAWLHKLRRAMVRPGREKLRGSVEVDETYYGAAETGVVGRLVDQKVLIMVAAERQEKGIGRIRLGCVPDLTRASLHGFVRDSVELGSTVRTDGLSIYRGLEGYVHDPIVIAHRQETASELLPCVHRVVSLLKRWLMGTHQGAVSLEHLPYYLDEFTFRFNRRTSASRGKLFYRLIQQAVQIGPHPYHALIDPNGLGVVE